MTDLWQSQAVKAMSLCCALLASLAAPAGAADVSIAGHELVYKAKVGEVNQVVVTLVAPGGVDGPDHDTIRITDPAANLFAVPPCVRSNSHTVTCDVPRPASVSLDLGNKNDTARQTDVSTGLSLPMKIFGGLGDDTLTGGFADDTIDGGPGADTIDGSDGNDTLTGGAEIDHISGGRGNDTIDGQLGDDTIDGGPGNDVIHGGAGFDTITGGAGSDQLFGDAGKGVLRSRDGEVDALDCGAGNETLDRDPADTVQHCG
jgi:Ca2+-binding RTX toxin-like protein